MDEQHPAHTPTTNTPIPTPRGIGEISLCDIALPESIIIYLEQDSSTLQTMERLYRLDVATNLPALYRAASRLEALAAVCKSNWAARMLLQSTNGPVSNQVAISLWAQTIPDMSQPSQYWSVVVSRKSHPPTLKPQVFARQPRKLPSCYLSTLILSLSLGDTINDLEKGKKSGNSDNRKCPHYFSRNSQTHPIPPGILQEMQAISRCPYVTT